MSVSTETAAKATSLRSQREKLERWLAEADALLAGQAEASPAVRGAA
ncbi:MAG TPA: hypothetical protein VFH58_11920 [Acidimicrobiales bacterium]|nr:hypothetical protein [Acidimicrobiales bacterium]